MVFPKTNIDYLIISFFNLNRNEKQKNNESNLEDLDLGEDSKTIKTKIDNQLEKRTSK
jgi:hypothetical protein